MTKFSKKVCLIGDFAVGKTSLVRRFVYDIFEDKYLSTVGVKVSRKVISLSNGATELTMMLWDLAGSEEFSQVRASYLRGTAGAVLICDLTRPETLESLHIYAQDLLSISPNAQIVLAANKCDLVDQQQLAVSQIERAASDLDTEYYLTSAKTGEKVEKLFYRLGQRLVASI